MSQSLSSAQGKKSLKVILLGETHVGKTSIIQRFVNNKFEGDYNPTIGIDFLKRSLNYKGQVCRLHLWDTAGQQRFRSLIPTYMKDADCAIFIFDVSRSETLQQIESWVRMYKDHRHQKSISLICGNKSDLQKKFDKAKLQTLMEKHKMPYMAVSAKTGQNIQDLFYLIVDMIYLNSDQGRRGSYIKQLKEMQKYDYPPGTKDSLFMEDKDVHTTNSDNKNVALDPPALKNKKWFCC